MVRKRSSAWAFFQEVESGSVRCLLCSDSLARPEYGATTNMLRHLRTKHPAEFNKTKDGVQENSSTIVLPEMKTDEPRCCSEIDIVLETDGDSNTFTTENNPADGIQEVEPGLLAELSADRETSDDQPMTLKRSWIWRHFEPLDGSARCRICSKRLQACKGGSTGNLHRHMSAKHPQVFRTPQSPPSMIRSLSEIDIVLETDGESFTTENNPADGIQEVEPGLLAELSADRETSDDQPMTLKRSWIWRHFEPLDGSARCHICSERLQACKGGSTGNLHRHMSAKHPQVFRTPQSPPSMKRSLSATMEDGDSDSLSTVSVAETNSAVNGIQEAAQGVPAEDHQTVEEQPVGRRHSWIWRHFDLLDGLAAVRCRICLRTLQDNGGTSNLHRHVSKKHPLLFRTRRFHSSPKRPLTVTTEDGDSHSLTMVNEAEISSAVSSIQEAAQGLPTKDNGTFEEQPAGRRHSWIWKHFDLLDGVAAARCRICLRTLQAYGSTGNLHRHVSKKHPLLFKSQQSHSSTKRLLSVTVEDGISGSLSAANVAETNSAVNGIQETAQGLQLPAKDNRRSKDRAIGRKRSWIWRHFSLLDGLAAVRCRICSRKLQGNGGTSNLNRHLSKKHPLLFRTHQSHSSLGSTDGSSAPLEAARQEVPAELITREKARDDLPVRCKRKLIWRHFELLESLAAARCRICMKKIRYLKGNSTRNLFRHMSKRHPQLCSQLVSDGLKVNGDALRTSESLGETEKHQLTKEQELIESLRTAQRKEAQALEEQKKLLKRLQAESAREAEAERQQIESLRRSQQEEAEELSRQKEELQKEKEELQKEKEELQKKWEELQQEREKLLLFSDNF